MIPSQARVLRYGGMLVLASALSAVAHLPDTATAQLLKLNTSLPPDADVLEFHITADSSRVVWVAEEMEQIGANLRRPLLSRTIDGSEDEAFLAGDLSTRRERIRFSADGTEVAFLAASDPQSPTSDDAIFVSPTDGSTNAAIINDPLPAGESIGQFEIAPDSSTVVWAQSLDDAVFSRRTDGSGAQTRLSDPTVRDDAVLGTFSITPDSQRVLWSEPTSIEDEFAFVSRPIDGSSAKTTLAISTSKGGFPTPNSARAVLRIDSVNLASRLIDGSGPLATLNNPVPNGVGLIGLPVISPDSRFAVWVAPNESPNVSEIFVRPVDGTGNQQKLNAAITPGGNVDAAGFQISPDSGHVVWMAVGDTFGVTELYSRPIDGNGNQAKLNAPLPAGGDVLTRSGSGERQQFAITPDSSRVIWMAVGDTDNVAELYSRPIDGTGNQVKINAPVAPVARESILSRSPIFSLSPDSQQVVYAHYDRRGASIVVSAVDGTRNPVQLHEPIRGGRLSDIEVTPDGSQIVFRAHSTEGNYELYSIPLDTSKGTAVPELRDAPPAKATLDDLQPGDKYHLMFATSNGVGVSGSDSIGQVSGFGGFNSADWLVTFNAFNANLPGAAFPFWSGTEKIYRAVISNSGLETINRVHARDRIHIGGAVFNTAGQRLAIDKGDLWDGSLENPVGFDEFANPIVDLPEVWTGTSQGGTSSSGCSDWSSSRSSDEGVAGSAISASADWTSRSIGTCNETARLYGISPVLTVPHAEDDLTLTIGDDQTLDFAGGADAVGGLSALLSLSDTVFSNEQYFQSDEFGLPDLLPFGATAAVDFLPAGDAFQLWNLTLLENTPDSIAISELSFGFDPALVTAPLEDLQVYQFDGQEWASLSVLSRSSGRLSVLPLDLPAGQQVDRLQFMLGTPVPEPSTFVLAILAAFWVIAVQRETRRTFSSSS